MLDVFVGYDPREAVAYHTFCNSVIRNTSEPVRFTPLYQNICGIRQRDGSNTFSYSRFLVPYLMGFTGRALYCDGDMICGGDIAELFSYGAGAPVACVKHNYRTRQKVKYLNSRNIDYPCKNWSSVMLFNCDAPACSVLTPAFLAVQSGQSLHSFEWCGAQNVDRLPAEWNQLVGEYAEQPGTKLWHYTLGAPCFEDYATCDSADEWHREFNLMVKPNGD